jgi:ATP-dependent RNA helicase DeaD
MMNDFSAFGLQANLLKNLEKMGYQAPTEVQAEAIGPTLEKRDVVIHSHTGSGKTAAFGIPFVQNAKEDIPAVQYLVLAPTRELAMQVSQEITKLAEGTSLLVSTIYGGTGYKKQLEQLKAGAQIIVGTPGRILDHLKKRTMSLSVTRGLALDEADKMLSMGFLPDVRLIMDYLPKRHQTLLASATFPPAIEAIIDNYMVDPVRIDLAGDVKTAKEIRHCYAVVSSGDKERALMAFLEKENPTQSMIFCNTRQEVYAVFQYLKHTGLAVGCLSSDQNQKEREKVLYALRVGRLQHLVCTDLASRGIDIPALSHVFIFSASEDIESYVHRTGRTGRAGQLGVAISLVSGTDIASFNLALKEHEIHAESILLPSDEEVIEAKVHQGMTMLSAIDFARDADVHEEFQKLAQHLGPEEQKALLPFLLERYFKAPKLPDWQRQEPPNSPQGETHESTESFEETESRPRNHRPPRSDRERHREPEGERKSATPKGPTLCVALGKKDGFSEDDIAYLLKKLGKLKPHQVGETKVFAYESFVVVPKFVFPQLLKLDGRLFRGHLLKVEKSPVPVEACEQFDTL